MIGADGRGGWGPLAEPYHADRELPPGSPPWRENVFFAFFDRERRVYGTSHFTAASNAGGRRARCSLVVDGRAMEIVEEPPPGSFDTPGVRLDLAGRVRATGAGRAGGWAADLSFTPGRPAADYTRVRGMPGLDEAEPIRHYQRSGTFSGTVSPTGSAPLEVSGGCIRDRTWGFREETQSWREYYACFLLFDAFDAMAMKFQVQDGGTRTNGFLIGDRSASVTGCAARRNGWGSITALTLTLADGTELPLTVSPAQARIFVPLGEPDGGCAITVYDEFVEVTGPDGERGFGLVEQGILRTLA